MKVCNVWQCPPPHFLVHKSSLQKTTHHFMNAWRVITYFSASCGVVYMSKWTMKNGMKFFSNRSTFYQCTLNAGTLLSIRDDSKHKCSQSPRKCTKCLDCETIKISVINSSCPHVSHMNSPPYVHCSNTRTLSIAFST